MSRLRKGHNSTEPAGFGYPMEEDGVTLWGGTMKIVAPVDRARQADVIEKILRHCGLWREPKQRGPPDQTPCSPEPGVRELT